MKKLREWGKAKRKRKPFDEHDLVNALIQQLKINTPFTFYYFIDRDSGQMRSTKSPWDFQLMRNGITRYFEAKVENHKLEPHQILARTEIQAANGYYGVPRFRNVKSLLDCEIHLEADGRPTKVFRMASVKFTDLFKH